MVKSSENSRRKAPSSFSREMSSSYPSMFMKTTTKPHKKEGNKAQNTGRWTKDEHLKFLAGLNEHGREWKKVAGGIITRTPAQIRSHAQKYFAKLKKDKLGVLCNATSTPACKRRSRPRSAGGGGQPPYKHARRPFSPTTRTNRQGNQQHSPQSPAGKQRRRPTTIHECYEETASRMRRIEQSIRRHLERRSVRARQYLRAMEERRSEAGAGGGSTPPARRAQRDATQIFCDTSGLRRGEGIQEAIAAIDRQIQRQFRNARMLAEHPRSRDIAGRGWLGMLSRMVREEQQQMDLEDVGFCMETLSAEDSSYDSQDSSMSYSQDEGTSLDSSPRSATWIAELSPSPKGERRWYYCCTLPDRDTLYSNASKESRARLLELAEDEICAVQVLACVRDSKPSTKDKAERFRLAELAETTKTDDSSDSYSSDNEDDLRRQRQLKQEDEYRRLQADAQRQQEQRRQRRFQQQQREEQAEQEERRRQQLKRRAQDLSPVSALGRHPKRMTASILARSRGRTYGR